MFRRTRNVASHIFRAFPGIQDDRVAVGQDAPDLLSANFLRFFVDLGERSAINAATYAFATCAKPTISNTASP
jgi:hypothetical protein